MRDVVVTGLGPVSAIGCGADTFWRALLAGESGIGPITLCDTSRSPSKIGAEVRGFALRDFIARGAALARRMPRPVQLAMAAAALALEDSAIAEHRPAADRLGVVVGTSVGNLGDVLSWRDDYADRDFPAHAAFVLFNNNAACLLSSHFDLRGPVHTLSTGCNSGLDALGIAAQTIKSGAADVMLVVGTDCELVTDVMRALNAARALCTRYNDAPAGASRPFDTGRDGNVLGEGAAAVILESAEHAERRGARVYARVSGYAVRGAGRDRAYSHDDPDLDLDPALRCLRSVVAQAGWQPAEVDVVNANGSSSVLYDRLEGRALCALFGDAVAHKPVHSIKGALGQHGAGSSALQIVASCLGLHHGVVPPTVNHAALDPACGPLRIVVAPTPLPAKRALVHAIGFGGFYYSAAGLAV